MLRHILAIGALFCSRFYSHFVFLIDYPPIVDYVICLRAAGVCKLRFVWSAIQKARDHSYFIVFITQA